MNLGSKPDMLQNLVRSMKWLFWRSEAVQTLT
jgi:hypothetical protein